MYVNSYRCIYTGLTLSTAVGLIIGFIFGASNARESQMAGANSARLYQHCSVRPRAKRYASHVRTIYDGLCCHIWVGSKRNRNVDQLLTEQLFHGHWHYDQNGQLSHRDRGLPQRQSSSSDSHTTASISTHLSRRVDRRRAHHGMDEGR